MSSVIICPNQNCGFHGPPNRKRRASLILGFVLLCFGLVPGIFYFLIKNGSRYLCPKCGLQVSSDG
jgi:hypothetical protein